MQITGDNQEGKRELDNFIDPAETYPVIATTSKLMTTGIDAQTCKLIVLDSNIGSMTEFKQIIGRGTRIKEEYGKTFFTILDFRSVTDKFADPDFDGEAERIKVVTEDEDFPNPEDENPPIDDDGNEVIIDEPPIIKPGGEPTPEPTIKIMVNGVNVAILNERVQYVDESGKLIMGSIKDYTKKMVKEQYHSLDEFLNKWNKADRKQVIIDELLEQGIVFDNFKQAINKEMDIFDLICHTAFDQPPLSRTERANNVKKRNYFTKYGEQAQKVLNALLDKYADEGIENIEDMKILQVNPFDEIGSPVEIVKMFGGKKNYLEALNELEHEIYKAA
jgi:type I restriction enzyme R subunit